MKCDICDFETDNRERFAGHRSGHTRRGEKEKNVEPERSCYCQVCGRTFDSVQQRTGHMQFHRVRFEDLKKDRARKSHLLFERGHHCEICGNTEWMNKPVPIHLDHIDGNPTNNAKENLRLVCPNCHAQTKTYCGKNIGRPKCADRERAKYPSYRT
jgi:hypothetical protein